MQGQQLSLMGDYFMSFWKGKISRRVNLSLEFRSQQPTGLILFHKFSSEGFLRHGRCFPQPRTTFIVGFLENPEVGVLIKGLVWPQPAVVDSESVFVKVYGVQDWLGIDSEESTPPSYVAWRAGTPNGVVVQARQAGNRFLGSLKGLQIPALSPQ